MGHRQKCFYIFDSDLSYFVGLTASDGCLPADKRHLNITFKDGEVIQNVCNILGLSVNFRTKISPYGSEAFDLSFSDVALYDFLLEVGLTPNKSRTLGRLNVPDEFYPDFLRGCFDGDGTVYGFWDQRWPSSLMYYFEVVSASRVYLEWLQVQNSRLIGVFKSSISACSTAEKISYAKKDSRLLFDYMYYETFLPMLTRKYKNFIAFLALDPYAIKE